MTSEEYGQYIDDFEMGIDVDPAETLTDYIERRRREFDSKADGGSIGIEVLFKEKMKDGGRAGFFMGGPALEGQALNIYTCLWDERLSTAGAFNISSQLDIKFTEKKKKIDENAATFISLSP